MQYCSKYSRVCSLHSGSQFIKKRLKIIYRIKFWKTVNYLIIVPELLFHIVYLCVKYSRKNMILDKCERLFWYEYVVDISQPQNCYKSRICYKTHSEMNSWNVQTCKTVHCYNDGMGFCENEWPPTILSLKKK